MAPRQRVWYTRTFTLMKKNSNIEGVGYAFWKLNGLGEPLNPLSLKSFCTTNPFLLYKTILFSPRQVAHEKFQNIGTPYNILWNIPWSKAQNHYWSSFASISKSYQQSSTSHSIIESVSQSESWKYNSLLMLRLWNLAWSLPWYLLQDSRRSN